MVIIILRVQCCWTFSGTQEALKQELARKGRADKAKRENVKEMRRKQDEEQHIAGARKSQERMEKIERIAEGRKLNVEKRAAMQVRRAEEQKMRRKGRKGRKGEEKKRELVGSVCYCSVCTLRVRAVQ